jgi:hypothetical protein
VVVLSIVGGLGLKKGLLVLVGLTVVVAGLAVGVAASGITRLPAQPLTFPHTIHAGELGISCQFCHRGAARDTAAGLPSVEQCMMCHRVVGRGKPGVERVIAAWEGKEPLYWVRVNRLPDHVHFDHQVHFVAGVSCTTCHGEVEQMVQVRRVRSLKMGDCLSCHRQQGANTDCAACHY